MMFTIYDDFEDDEKVSHVTLRLSRDNKTYDPEALSEREPQIDYIHVR